VFEGGTFDDFSLSLIHVLFQFGNFSFMKRHLVGMGFVHDINGSFVLLVFEFKLHVFLVLGVTDFSLPEFDILF
jgi:hypothetical protein